MKGWVVAALLVPLAGCAADVDPVLRPDGREDSGLDLRATQTTGVILGFVVDEAIRPLPGAEVELSFDKRVARTNDKGAFGFDGLPAGTHFLTIKLSAYRTVQQSAEVTAGIADPPPLKIVLVADPAAAPYIESYSVAMFKTFGSPFIGLGTAFDQALGQTSAFLRGELQATATVAQVELQWQATTSTAQHVQLVGATWNEDDNVGVDVGIVQGASPLLSRVNGIMEDLRATYFFMRVDPIPWDPLQPHVIDPAGIAIINQQFQGFAFVFHNVVPDPQWSFVRDGPYPLPKGS